MVNIFFIFQIHSSNIPVYIDFTSPLTLLSGAYLLRAFRDFLVNMKDVFGPNAYIYFNLVHVEETYFGDFNYTMAHTLDPAVILIETQVVPLILSGLYIINIRRFANFERDLVSGVKPIEILLAHFIQTTVLILIQALFTLLVAFGINGSQQNGSYFDVFLLLVLFGLLSSRIGISIALYAKHNIFASTVSIS